MSLHKNREEAIRAAMEQVDTEQDVGMAIDDDDGEEGLAEGHVQSRACWCQPELINYRGTNIVVHRQKQ
jgi:hypothetical protein